MSAPASPPTVRPRARSREDRAGDPLDGLVNLFDLGIVLSVAFLLAALSSLKLGPDVLGKAHAPTTASARTAPAGSILAPRDARVRAVQIQPGQKVEIACDGCAAPITASVSFIAPQAEYTSPVIYSKESRA